MDEKSQLFQIGTKFSKKVLEDTATNNPKKETF